MSMPGSSEASAPLGKSTVRLLTSAQPRFASAALWLALGGMLWTLWLYRSTLRNMVSLWVTNETYTHGFIIAPLSAWMIWRQRAVLASIAHRPSLWGLAALAIAGATWLVADAAQVDVTRQYALVAMLIGWVVAINGVALARTIAFPLAFLLFMVPVGDALLAPLMTFTADFTVAALHVTGVPVFREGLYFELPSGKWSVVEACSGLRYLIASITLGCLYAYLAYRSARRRAIFVLVSAIVPILANGVRAYLIVMLGHLSDMKLAVGVDHLVYGWLFFGIVMLLLFWIGARWQEVPDENSAVSLAHRPVARSAAYLHPIAWPAAIVALGLTAVAPVASGWLKSGASDTALTLSAPTLPGWAPVTETHFDWRPAYSASRGVLEQTYSRSEQQVTVFVRYYRDQDERSRLISGANRLAAVDSNARWREVETRSVALPAATSPALAIESLLKGPGEELLVYSWYWIGGQHTTSPAQAKWIQAKNLLTRVGDDAALVVIATPIGGDVNRARQTLTAFASQATARIASMLAATQRGVREH